jgi:hypothetical protein
MLSVVAITLCILHFFTCKPYNILWNYFFFSKCCVSFNTSIQFEIKYILFPVLNTWGSYCDVRLVIRMIFSLFSIHVCVFWRLYFITFTCTSTSFIYFEITSFFLNVVFHSIHQFNLKSNISYFLFSGLNLYVYYKSNWNIYSP